MIIYKVVYRGINWEAYFGGSWNFIKTQEKIFSTKEKALDFINNPYDEFVPTWDRYERVKEAGVGTLIEMEVD